VENFHLATQIKGDRQKSSANLIVKRRIFPPILPLYEEIDNLSAYPTMQDPPEKLETQFATPLRMTIAAFATTIAASTPTKAALTRSIAASTPTKAGFTQTKATWIKVNAAFI
jgi:hypothetical protein